MHFTHVRCEEGSKEGGQGGREGGEGATSVTDTDEGLEPGEVERIEHLLVGDVVLRERPIQAS